MQLTHRTLLCARVGRIWPCTYLTLMVMACLIAAFLARPLSAATRTWTGASNANWSNSANWQEGAAPADGDDIVFHAAGAGNLTTNNNSGGIHIKTITLNSTGTSPVTIGGDWFYLGSGGIDMSSASKNLTINAHMEIELNFSTTFSVAAGRTLTWSGTGELANDAYPLIITGEGTTVISGALAEVGGITKSGSGTLTLSGANTYRGGTTLSAGTLNINSATALGTGTFTISGGIIDNTSGSSITLSNNNAQSWNGNFTFTGSNALNLGTGAVTLSANRTVTVSASTLTVGGAIGDGGNARTLTKDGSGTLVLSGTNTYTGTTTVNAGVLNIRNAQGTGTTDGGVTVASGAALELQGGITVGAENLQITGTGVSGNGALRNISGVNTWGGTVMLSASATTIQSDADSLKLTAANSINASNINLTLQGSGHGKIDGTITTGSGTLTKAGSGTWVLGGANTYTGTTTVNAGVLNIRNAQGTGTTEGGVNVASGAALELQGGITVGAENLSIAGDGISNNGALRNISGNNTWGGTITQNAASRIQSDAGTLTLNNGTTAITGAYNLILEGAGNGVVSGPITISSGTLTKNDAGTWTLSGANTYSGGTTLNAGTLNINSATALGTGTFTISGGIIDNTSGSSITLSNNNAQSWNGNFTFTGSNALNLGTGAVTLSANRTVTVSASTLTVGGAIGDGGNARTLTKDGSGTLVLSGANTYTGATTVSAGTLSLTGSVTSNVSVSAGATLAGTGTVTGTITLATGSPGGTLSPGTSATPATLTTSGATTMNSGAVFSVDIAGNGSNDKLSRSGANVCNLGSATLSLTLAYAPSVGHSYTIIDNTNASGSISGQFSCGTQITAQYASTTYYFTINYSGGTGNDVVLTCTQPKFTEWTGSSSTAWATAGNWQNGVPTSWDTVLYNTNSTQNYANQNNNISSLSNMVIRVLNPAGDVGISSGNSIGLAANGIDMSSASDNLSIAVGLSFGASQTWNVNSGRTLTVSGAVSGAYNLTKSGGGTLVLSGDNNGASYANAISVSAGILRASHNGALGTTDGATTVSSGAQLQMQGTSAALTIAEPLTLNGSGISSDGALYCLGSYDVTASGAITFGSASHINVAADRTLTLSSTTDPSGNYTVTKVGAGTLLLSQDNSTWGGNIVVSAGRLKITDASALGNTTGATTVSSGATLDVGVDSVAEPLTISGTGVGGIGAIYKSLAGTATYSGNITLAGESYIGNGGDDWEFSGVISGSYGIRCVGPGSINFANKNTYTGSTIIDDCELNIVAGGSIPNNSSVNIINGGSLVTWGDHDTIGSLAGEPGTRIYLFWAKNLSCGGNNESTTFAGVIQEDGSLTKTGTGTLTLSGANTYTGATALNGGGICLTGSLSSNVTVASGATFSGTGSNTGTLTVQSGGTLSPGTSSTLGKLTNSGNVTLASGSTFIVRLNSPNEHDTLSAGGTVDLGGATLSLTLNHVPQNGSTYRIVDKTSSGAISNQFSCGTSISASYNGSNYTFSVSYTGGTGNDVVLTCTTADVTRQWTGGGTDNNWNTSGNWSGGVPVNNCIVLYHTSSTARLTSGINNISGLSGITIKVQNPAGDVSIASGNSLTLNANGIDMAAAEDNLSIAIQLVFSGNQIWNVNSGRTLAISGNLSGAYALTKTGAGTLTLSGTNTHSQGTTLSAGTLNLNSSAAPGTGTLTINGGTINNTSGASVTLSNNNAQVWNADFTYAGTNALNLGTGNVTLSANRTVTVSASTLTVGGVIAGAYSLTKAGSGALSLSGANIHTGGTTLSAGTLNINNASALGGLTGSISYQKWDGISGNAVSDLTGNANYPNNPSSTGFKTSFDMGSSLGDNYGIRMQGYIVPPTTGTYYFWIASDDNSELWLSTDMNPSNKTKIAEVSGSGWTGQYEWTKYSSQASSGKSLIAGQFYYVEALMKEATGGDNLAVGWQGPGISSTTVVAGQYLAPYPLPAFTISGGTIDNTSGGSITLSGNIPQTWNGDFTFTGTNDLNLASGAVTLGGNRTVTVSASTLTVGGAIGDGGNARTLTKDGSGTLVLSGANTYTGATTVSAGTLSLTGSVTSNVSVSAGATLAGTGTVTGTITLATGSPGGTLSPGTSATPATLTTSGATTMNSGAVFSVDIAGNGSNDKLSRSGANVCNLGSATLSLTLAYAPSVGHSYTIIDNTNASGSISGQFSCGTQITAQYASTTYYFTINYSGGTGNDVVLTCASIAPAEVVVFRPITVASSASADTLYTSGWRMVFTDALGGGIAWLADSNHINASNEVPSNRNLFYIDYNGVASYSIAGNATVLESNAVAAKVRQSVTLSSQPFTIDYAVHGCGRMYVRVWTDGPISANKTLKFLITRQNSGSVKIRPRTGVASSCPYILLSDDGTDQNDFIFAPFENLGGSGTWAFDTSSASPARAGWSNTTYSLGVNKREAWEFLIDFGRTASNDSSSVTHAVATDYRTADSLQFLAGYLFAERAWEMNLQGHWSFESGVGDTARDVSGNNRHGKITGASWSAGRFGNGLTCDGNDEVAVATNNAFNGTDDFTIMAWIKTSSLSDGVIFMKASSQSGNLAGYRLGGSSGKLRFSFGTGGSATNIDGSTTITDNTWRHVAVRFTEHSPDTVTLFVDGKVDAIYTGNYAISGNSTYDVYIAKNFSGIIDEVRFYSQNFGLSDAAIRAIYLNGYNPGSGELLTRADDNNTLHLYCNTGAITRYFPVFKIFNYWSTDGTPDCVYLNGSSLGNPPDRYVLNFSDQWNHLTLALDTTLTATARVFMDDDDCSGNAAVEPVPPGTQSISNSQIIYQNFTGTTMPSTPKNFGLIADLTYGTSAQGCGAIDKWTASEVWNGANWATSGTNLVYGSGLLNTVKWRNRSFYRWQSYSVVTQSGSPQATVTSEAGDATATIELYESTNNGGVNKGSLFSTFNAGQHPEGFNNVQAFWWSGSGGEAYPYAGKSTVGRGSDAGESNTPSPTGVYDLQLHPPNSARLVVAAFVAPVAGMFSVSGLGVRRVSSSGNNATLKVFNNSASLVTSLQATNNRAWVTSGSSYDMGNLSVGDRIYFAVDSDGNYSYDATEIAFTITCSGSYDSSWGGNVKNSTNIGVTIAESSSVRLRVALDTVKIASAGSLYIDILRPTGDGVVELLRAGTGANYDAVDDVTPDDATTYVRTDEQGRYYTDYYVTADGQRRGSIIDSVVVRFRARRSTSGANPTVEAFIRRGTTNYYGVAVPFTSTTWKDTSYTWVNDPSTSAAWTWDGVDAMQIGLRAYTTNYNVQAQITQVFAQVYNRSADTLHYIRQYTFYPDGKLFELFRVTYSNRDIDTLMPTIALATSANLSKYWHTTEKRAAGFFRTSTGVHGMAFAVLGYESKGGASVTSASLVTDTGAVSNANERLLRFRLNTRPASDSLFLTDSIPYQLAFYYDFSQDFQTNGNAILSVVQAVVNTSNALRLITGSLVTSDPGDLDKNGFNDAEGCWVVSALNNTVHFGIDSKNYTRYNPIFKIVNYTSAVKPQYVFLYRPGADTLRLLEGYQYSMYHDKANKRLVMQLDTTLQTDSAFLYVAIDPTLAVQMEQFWAVGGDRCDTVCWVTQSEEQNLGFILYRRIKPEFLDSLLRLTVNTNLADSIADGAIGLMKRGAISAKDTSWKEVFKEIIPGAPGGNSVGPRTYRIIDRHLHNDVLYQYRIVSVSFTNERETFPTLAEAMPRMLLPSAFALWRNHPNPFKGYTTIRYDLPKTSRVCINVYDMKGRLVRRLVRADRPLKAGYYRVVWNGTDDYGRRLVPGPYIYQMVAGKYRKAMVMIMTR